MQLWKFFLNLYKLKRGKISENVQGRMHAFFPVFFCAEGISQAEMFTSLFGAARESEKLAKRVSHDWLYRKDLAL